MTTGQVPCIDEYRNNKFFFVSILYVFKIQNDDVSRIRNRQCMTLLRLTTTKGEEEPLSSSSKEITTKGISRHAFVRRICG